MEIDGANELEMMMMMMMNIIVIMIIVVMMRMMVMVMMMLMMMIFPTTKREAPGTSENKKHGLSWQFGRFLVGFDRFRMRSRPQWPPEDMLGNFMGFIWDMITRVIAQIQA